MKYPRIFLWPLAAVIINIPACASAQRTGPAQPQALSAISPELMAALDSSIQVDSAEIPANFTPVVHFRSHGDSLQWVRARDRAGSSEGYRLVISLFDRRMWVMDGEDTLRTAQVAVAKGTTLEYGGRTWHFRTPRGVRHVLEKDSLPVWIPPDWHYVEVAEEYNLKIGRLPANRPVKLDNGAQLVVQDSIAGVIFPDDSVFAALPLDEEIVFDSTLYIPPVNSRNRRIEGELGKFKLDLGDGYLLHGTPHQASIGRAATHGCIRLRDADIEWLYENVPVGTRVYIY